MWRPLWVLAVVVVVVPSIGWSGSPQVLIDGQAPSAAETRVSPAVDPATPIVFTITSETAAAVAEAKVRSLGEPERIVVGTPSQAFYRRPTDGLKAPVWSVDVATARPWNLWRVFVSGDDGNIIRVADLTRRARGLVFPTVASVSQHAPSVRALQDLDGDGFLDGAAARVDDVIDYLALCPTTELFCAPPRSRTCSASSHGGKFIYPTHSHGTFESCNRTNRFDQVQAYFHLAKMARYFETHLGRTPGTGTLAGKAPLPVLINVPLLANAFFAPPSDAVPDPFLAFGDSFDSDQKPPPEISDFTRDPTVPRHEFTHSVVFDLGTALNDDLTCVTNCSPYIAAMNEALADYYAVASFNGHPTIVGSQLGSALVEGGAARNLVNDFRFPCDLTGEPHSDGRIWEGFLYEVRQIFGGTAADRAIFASLPALPHSPATLQFSDGLAAVVNALSPDPRGSIRLVEHAVRHGLIGPSAFDRLQTLAKVIVTTADDPWTCISPNDCTSDTMDHVEGTASARIDIGDGFPGGLAAYQTLDPPADLRGQPILELFVEDTNADNPGDLAIVLDDTDDCSSPLRILPLPGISPGPFQQVSVAVPGTDDLGSVACVGLLVNTVNGARTIKIDNVFGTSGTRFGPTVVTLPVQRTFTLRNRFPAPFGDAHFYYFQQPPGTTRITVVADTARRTQPTTGLTYCGNIQAGQGFVALPELNNVFVWAYDKSQPVVLYDLTPLPIDQHLLVTGVSASTKRHRQLRRYPLQGSPTGIYAVSVQGSGDYRLKLKFE